MRILVLSLLMAALVPPAHAEAEWMAGSECSKSLKGKSGKDYRIRIGMMTLTPDNASCEVVSKAKAVKMISAGWDCTVEGTDHFCSQVTKAEEDLGLNTLRHRKPVMFTYLVFTDLDGHLTQISFWDMPKQVAAPFCESFRQSFEKAGVKDAVCIPGNS